MPGPLGADAVIKSFDGPMEIVSLTGTLGPDGMHVHISLARADGACIGGHLVSGCIVHTTAELVIGALEGAEFRRQPDPVTGYAELSVAPRRSRRRPVPPRTAD
jgi:predicted DNA-binding protein with PD1-like motif